MMEWQPIETAPRDDTEVLLYCEKFLPEIGKEYGPGICVGSSQGVRGWSVAHSDYYRVELVATHWMPLPPSPVSP